MRFPPRLFGSGSRIGSPRIASASSLVISLHGSGNADAREAGTAAELVWAVEDAGAELLFELQADKKRARTTQRVKTPFRISQRDFTIGRSDLVVYCSQC